MEDKSPTRNHGCLLFYVHYNKRCKVLKETAYSLQKLAGNSLPRTCSLGATFKLSEAKEGAHKKTVWNVASPGAVVSFWTQSHEQEEEAAFWTIQETTHPMLFFFFLYHTHTGIWVSGLKPSFPALWGEVKHKHLKGDSEQGRSRNGFWGSVLWALLSSQLQLLPEPRWQPACLPRHCLLKDEPGSGSSHGFSKLAGFSLGKQEMEGCP